MPHPTPSVDHISLPTRDQMDLAMGNGLASNSAIIDADVEAFHFRVRGGDPLSFVSQKFIAGIQLRSSQIEVGSHMALGDDQRVQVGDGILVADDVSQLVAADEALFGHGAEEALLVTIGKIIILRENQLAKRCNQAFALQLPEGPYAVVEFENGSQSVVEDFSKVKWLRVR
jgi:hypothetical protein